ncbi:MAG: MmpS family protein, partial [Actinomycetota bacterium]|nr:MmpS family protein [Actinomycetota bacterium]
MFTIAKRAWVPLVITAAAAAGTAAVVNLRGAFGSDEIFHWDGS